MEIRGFPQLSCTEPYQPDEVIGPNAGVGPVAWLRETRISEMNCPARNGYGDLVFEIATLLTIPGSNEASRIPMV